MTLIDHNALIGPFPFRRLPEPTPARLVAEMDRLGIDAAWVGHLPSVFYRDVAAGNDELFAALERHRGRLRPVPAVNPAYPGWEREVARAGAAEAPAVRTYPTHFGVDPAGRAMAALGAACADAGLELVLTVRFEDARQRHPLDVAPDLIGAAIRATIRCDRRLKVLVTAADRALVEEVHFGSTAEEAARIRWDVSWIWGPPEDHLATLFRTVGRERFVLGTHFPLRLPEAAVTKLELSG
jgi:hypothetical protein